MAMKVGLIHQVQGWKQCFLGLSPRLWGGLWCSVLVALLGLKNLPQLTLPSPDQLSRAQAACKDSCSADSVETCTDEKAARRRTQERYKECQRSRMPPELKMPPIDAEQVEQLIQAYVANLPAACRNSIKRVRMLSAELHACSQNRTDDCHPIQQSVEESLFKLHRCVKSHCRKMGSQSNDTLCISYGRDERVPNCSKALTELKSAQQALRKCTKDPQQNLTECRSAQDKIRMNAQGYAECKRKECLLYPKQLSRLLCRPSATPPSAADCSAQMAARHQAQETFKACRRARVLGKAGERACWDEVRACESQAQSEYRSKLDGVRQTQWLLDASLELLSWVFAVLGLLWVWALGPIGILPYQIFRYTVLVASVLLLSWLGFGLLIDFLFPRGLIAH